MRVGQKYLITTDNWFYAPDGDNYRAIFGTLHGICNDGETLGIKTNRGSTNWYAVIGDMVVAGCQIHYVVRADNFNDAPGIREGEHEGRLIVERHSMSRIYNADHSGLRAEVL